MSFLHNDQTERQNIEIDAILAYTKSNIKLIIVEMSALKPILYNIVLMFYKIVDLDAGLRFNGKVNEGHDFTS